MRNKIYIKSFNEEINNKIDLIRQFIGVDSYQDLRIILSRIEEGLYITEHVKWHLKHFYGLEYETLTVSNIKEYIDLFYKLNENTFSMQLIQFHNCLSDLVNCFVECIQEDWSSLKESCKKIKKRFLG